jgi:DNA-binding response OmpR family regulator
MAELGCILIADDEETFLESTGDLLRRDGYHCDCVPDATTAMDKLKNNEYDLLITDIEMPGNTNLELVRDLTKIAEGLPVILVTGYPSQRSAIQAIQLPVIAYLVKPFDLEELLSQVNKAIVKFRLYKAATSTRDHLQNWQKDVANLEQVLGDKNVDTLSTTVKSFLDLSFSNIVGALSDIEHITKTTTTEDIDLPACHLLNCPILAELTRAMEETITVLEKTKSAFKSKDLGAMRKRLEDLMNKIKIMRYVN